MSRKSNSAQRRSEIVAALLFVLAEQGYEKATIQAIAKRANLTPGLIHYHFETKAEILLSLIASLNEVFRERYLSFAETATSPEQKLHAYLRARLAKGEGANPEAVAAWVVIGAEAVRQVEVREMYQAAIKDELSLVQQLLKECFIAKGKRSNSAPQVAAAILALMEGSFQLSSAAEDVMPKGYAASTVIKFIDRFIAGEETTN